jgi:glycine C-acetyltransferase
MTCRPPFTAPSRPTAAAALPEPLAWIDAGLESLRRDGLERPRRVRAGRQGRVVELDGRALLNFGSNDYLGLAGDVRLTKAASRAACAEGFGSGASPLVSGHSSTHAALEAALSDLLDTGDALLFPSGFAANAATIAALVGPGDVIFSDERNHASIIDGCRLSRATVAVFPHRDVAALDRLLAATPARRRLIVTDSLFSMDGTIAPLAEICDLADKHGAVVMMDDSHGVGFLGKTGRGTHEHRGCQGRVDIITGTLGKALGGASGGYTSGRKEVIEILRQQSRTYLFSNSVAPVIVATTLAILKLLRASTELRDQLMANAAYWRKGLTELGFTLPPGEHPIVPIMLGDGVLAQKFAAALLEHGVYAVGFFYPVVAQGKARIRTQLSAAHTRAELDEALAAFAAAKRDCGL